MCEVSFTAPEHYGESMGINCKATGHIYPPLTSVSSIPTYIENIAIKFFNSSSEGSEIEQPPPFALEPITISSSLIKVGDE